VQRAGLDARIVCVENPNERGTSKWGFLTQTKSECGPVQNTFYDVSCLLHVTREIFIEIVFQTQLRNKTSLTLEPNANLMARENILQGIKLLNGKMHLQKLFFSFHLSTISINKIRHHLVTVWFNKKVTSFFGPWRMQGQSWTSVQDIYRNVKSSSLNWSAL